MLYTVQPQASAPSQIGVVLRQWRRDAGLRQTQLSEAISIEQSHISAVERGCKAPTVRMIGAWARACGQDLSKVAPHLAQMAGFDAEEVKRLAERLMEDSEQVAA